MPENSVGQVYLDLGINSKEMKKDLNGISGIAKKQMTSAFKGLAKVMLAAFSVKKLVDFGKAAIKLASSLQEIQNVVDVTFGAMSDQINEFAKTALDAFGLSELSAKRFTSFLGAMLKTSGITSQKLVDMSTSMAGFAGNMASFFDLKPEEAFAKLQSALAGEIKPLRDLGINMSVANLEAFNLSQGITQSFESMSEANRMITRYNFLMTKGVDIQGDFKRTSKSWANQTKILTERWNAMSAVMGEAFIVILTPVIQMLNTIISKLHEASLAFKGFVNNMFGIKKAEPSEGMKALADAAVEAGDSVADAAKKAKSSVSAFDELNVLSSTSDTGGIAAGEEMDLLDPTQGLDQIDLSEKKDELNALQIIARQVTSTFGRLGTSVKDAFGPVVTQAIDMFKSKFDLLKETFIIVATTLGKVFMPVINWFIEKGVPIIAEFVSSTLHVLDALLTGIIEIFNLIWTTGVEPVLNYLVQGFLNTLELIKILWDTWGKDIMSTVIRIIENIVNGFKEFWNVILLPLIEGGLAMFNRLWDKYLEDVIVAVLGFISKLAEYGRTVYDVFIKPIIDYLTNDMKPIWKFIIDGLIKNVEAFLSIVIEVGLKVIEALGGLLEFLMGVFTGDWERAWEGLKTFVLNIWDGIWIGIKGFINMIIGGINTMVRGINKVEFDLPDWIPGDLGGKSLGFNIPEIPKLANGGLVSAPTLAMVGDNKNAAVDPEVVSPLSKLEGMMTGSNQMIIEVLLRILQAIEGQEMSLDIDGERLSRVIRRYLDSEDNRLGRKTVTVGGQFI